MARTVKTRERSISERLALRRTNGHHSGRRKKRQALLYDPPELRLLQKERNKPMADWPGEFIGLRYVMAACGNPKDWFKYGHRAQVHQEYNWMWAQAYAERRDRHLTFKHNQILVIGEYGQGKTTLCVHHAVHRAFWWGHPVFTATPPPSLAAVSAPRSCTRASSICLGTASSSSTRHPPPPRAAWGEELP